VTIYIAVELSNPTCLLSVGAKSSIMFKTIAPSYYTVSGNYDGEIGIMAKYLLLKN
jgi:hypothetical protein